MLGIICVGVALALIISSVSRVQGAAGTRSFERAADTRSVERVRNYEPWLQLLIDKHSPYRIQYEQFVEAAMGGCTSWSRQTRNHRVNHGAFEIRDLPYDRTAETWYLVYGSSAASVGIVQLPPDITLSEFRQRKRADGSPEPVCFIKVREDQPAREITRAAMTLYPVTWPCDRVFG